MSERLYAGRLVSSVTEVVDAGVELLPHFELAAIPVLDGAERPAEWPAVRRRLRAEGIRVAEHRGVLLLVPGEVERVSAIGMLHGHNELYLCADWNDEFEAFPGRITREACDFVDGTPLGLEEWMMDTGCLLALGDGAGLNFATFDAGLAAGLRSRFVAAQD